MVKKYLPLFLVAVFSFPIFAQQRAIQDQPTQASPQRRAERKEDQEAALRFYSILVKHNVEKGKASAIALLSLASSRREAQRLQRRFEQGGLTADQIFDQLRQEHPEVWKILEKHRNADFTYNPDSFHPIKTQDIAPIEDTGGDDCEGCHWAAIDYASMLVGDCQAECGPDSPNCFTICIAAWRAAVQAWGTTHCSPCMWVTMG